MLEIFDPRTGKPVYRTRFQFIARLICRISIRRGGFLDYARAGEGWL